MHQLGIDADAIEPRGLARDVAPRALVQRDGEALAIEAEAARIGQAAGRPEPREPRVLEDAAAAPDLLDGSRRAIMLAAAVHVAKTAPGPAGRMSDHRQRALIEPRVALQVPGIDIGAAEVRAAPIDIQSGDSGAHPHCYASALALVNWPC